MSSDEVRVTTFFRAKIKEDDEEVLEERGERLYFRNSSEYDLVEESLARLYLRKVDLCSAIAKSYTWKKKTFVIQEVDVIVVSTEDYKPK